MTILILLVSMKTILLHLDKILLPCFVIAVFERWQGIKSLEALLSKQLDFRILETRKKEQEETTNDVLKSSPSMSISLPVKTSRRKHWLRPNSESAEYSRKS